MRFGRSPSEYWSEPRSRAFQARAPASGLSLDIPGQRTYALLPPDEEGRWFFAVTDTVSVVFVKDDEGAVTAIQITNPRRTDELPRVEDDPDEGGL